MKSTHREKLLSELLLYEEMESPASKQRMALKAIIHTLQDDSPSQIAINVSEAAIKFAALSGPDEAVAEEKLQRAYLENTL